MGGVLYSFFLITGSAAMAIALGLAIAHWAADAHVVPYLDRDGWLLAAYGLTTSAGCSVVAGGDPVAYTMLLVVLAVLSGFTAGRRTCGPLLLFVAADEPDTD